MSRYIDADELLHDGNSKGGCIDEHLIDSEISEEQRAVLEAVRKMILNAPTIDLVRCAECKESRESVYFEEHPTCVFKAYQTLCCRMLKISVDPDFYCGHGERKK